MPGENKRADVAAAQRALREDFGLGIPFTTGEFRAALDQVRARRGMGPGELPRLRCTYQLPDGAFVTPVPQELGRAEQEHVQFHQLAHIVLKHTRPGKTTYTVEEERYAEAFADEMLTRGLGSVAVE